MAVARAGWFGEARTGVAFDVPSAYLLLDDSQRVHGDAWEGQVWQDRKGQLEPSVHGHTGC